jgi:hypothetical protein
MQHKSMLRTLGVWKGSPEDMASEADIGDETTQAET